MSGSYDFDSQFGVTEEDETDSEPSTLEEAAESAFAELAPATEEAVESDDSYMDEVDRRLEVTSYYRELMRGSLFAGQGTPASRIVEREVRKFVQQRLEVLLGMRSPVATPTPVALPFTELQITALTVWANKLLTREEAPAKPELRQASPARPPVVTPVTSKPIPAVSVAPPPPQAAKPPAAPQAAPPAQAKKKPGPKPGQKKTVIDPDTGEEKQITVQKGQVRSSKSLPFPTTPQELGAMTSAAASMQVAQGQVVVSQSSTVASPGLMSGVVADALR